MRLTSDTFNHPEIADIDRHFAEFIADFGGGEIPALAAAMVSRNLRLGHTCLSLETGPVGFETTPPEVYWPKLTGWRDHLEKSRAVGGPDDGRPLVLDAVGRLYLRRYWEYETTLAREILKRCDRAVATAIFSDETLQEVAITAALTRRFVVISGGPGTGKTTTVVRILERLVSAPAGDKLRIALTAPTGKAAQRLQEALRANSTDFKITELLPKSASTLHRLLGPREGSAYFRHDVKNPLPLDLVVVDEASMVPLTLMAKFFAALPTQARVILLGDCDQLASVEPGAVLGDIAEAAAQSSSPIHGSLVVLRKNYRFGNESRIFSLCNAVRDGDVAHASEILRENGGDELAAKRLPAAARLAEELRAHVLKGYGAYLCAGDPRKALEAFRKFRVLCALRIGPYGVESLNWQIEAILREEGLLRGPAANRAGMPVMITRNDYGLRLFNGDIGIIRRDENGAMAAWFSGGENELRQIPPTRLPAHEPAFAMTVHKSQGSEFDNVLLILPEKDSAVMTRELIYTGLTRARKRIEVWYEEDSLRSAIVRKTARQSGLAEMLGAVS